MSRDDVIALIGIVVLVAFIAIAIFFGFRKWTRCYEMYGTWDCELVIYDNPR